MKRCKESDEPIVVDLKDNITLRDYVEMAWALIDPKGPSRCEGVLLRQGEISV